jgi:hypothetical protein
MPAQRLQSRDGFPDLSQRNQHWCIDGFLQATCSAACSTS